MYQYGYKLYATHLIIIIRMSVMLISDQHGRAVSLSNYNILMCIKRSNASSTVWSETHPARLNSFLNLLTVQTAKFHFQCGTVYSISHLYLKGLKSRARDASVVILSLSSSLAIVKVCKKQALVISQSNRLIIPRLIFPVCST